MGNFSESINFSSKLIARKRNLSEYNDNVGFSGDIFRPGAEIESEWTRGRPNLRNQSICWREEIAPTIDISPDKDEDTGKSSVFSVLHSSNLPSRRIVSPKNNNLDIQEGWSSVAIQAVHAVADKAWEFCKSSAALFSGFHSGGGTKYQLNKAQGKEARFEAIDSSVWPREWHMKNSKPRTPNLHDPANQLSTTCENTPTRSSKRCQIHPNRDNSLEKNWVVIPPIPSSPHHTRARAERNRSTTSSTTRLPHMKSYSTSSSRFATRPSLISQYTHQPNAKSRVSYASSASLKSPERASFASPRLCGTRTRRLEMPAPLYYQQKKSHFSSPEVTLHDSQHEAQRLAAMIEKDEQQQDDSLRRLESRLKTMIREGKEALGAKIEVGTKTSGKLEPRNIR